MPNSKSNLFEIILDFLNRRKQKVETTRVARFETKILSDMLTHYLWVIIKPVYYITVSNRQKCTRKSTKMIYILNGWKSAWKSIMRRRLYHFFNHLKYKSFENSLPVSSFHATNNKNLLFCLSYRPLYESYVWLNGLFVNLKSWTRPVSLIETP